MNCAVLVVWSVLLLLPVYCGPGQPVGPDGTSTGQQGDCPAEVRIPISRLATLHYLEAMLQGVIVERGGAQ